MNPETEKRMSKVLDGLLMTSKEEFMACLVVAFQETFDEGRDKGFIEGYNIGTEDGHRKGYYEGYSHAGLI